MNLQNRKHAYIPGKQWKCQSVTEFTVGCLATWPICGSEARVDSLDGQGAVA